MGTDETPLASAYLFAGLSEAQLAQVTAAAKAVALEKGEHLFAQGDPASLFYFLAGGRIKLYRLSPDGNEKVIELIGPGQTFAEALMFDGGDGTYPVHASAVEPSRLLAIRNSDFIDLLRDSVETCFRIMGSMSRRLHTQVTEIERLTLHTATDRLVAFLLEQATDENPLVHLEVTKSLLASRLSIQPETFSRILARLSRQGLIEVKGNDIRLLDRAGLQALREPL